MTASLSIASWSVEHAVYFTIAAAIAAVMSGLAGAFFYAVSIYYKIKHDAPPHKVTVPVTVTVPVPFKDPE